MPRFERQLIPFVRWRMERCTRWDDDLVVEVCVDALSTVFGVVRLLKRVVSETDRLRRTAPGRSPIAQSSDTITSGPIRHLASITLLFPIFRAWMSVFMSIRNRNISRDYLVVHIPLRWLPKLFHALTASDSKQVVVPDDERFGSTGRRGVGVTSSGPVGVNTPPALGSDAGCSSMQDADADALVHDDDPFFYDAPLSDMDRPSSSQHLDQRVNERP
jgi:hypothetical protein